MIEVTDFDKQVIERSRIIPVLVKVTANWCAPCRAMEATVEAIANDFLNEIEVVTIDADTNSSFLERVSTLPTFIMFINGHEISREIGAMMRVKLYAFVEQTLPWFSNQQISSGES